MISIICVIVGSIEVVDNLLDDLVPEVLDDPCLLHEVDVDRSLRGAHHSGDGLLLLLVGLLVVIAHGHDGHDVVPDSDAPTQVSLDEVDLLLLEHGLDLDVGLLILAHSGDGDPAVVAFEDLIEGEF